MNKVNPFLRFMSQEDHLQHQVITFLAYGYPGIKYHHSPDSGKRSKFEQFKYKYLGSDAGFPDLIFPELQLVMELKIKPNKPTPAQLLWLAHFEKIGWTTAVCYEYEAAIKVIKHCIENKKAA